MIIKKPDQILDEAIFQMRRGAAVSDCAKKYPKNAWLVSALNSAMGLKKIPVKNISLNEKAVWNRVLAAISRKTLPENNRSRLLIPAFRIAIPRGAFAFLILVAALGLVNTTAVAAQNSIPGQTLYPVKRTVEKIQLTLTINEEKKTEVRIKHAEQRLAEVKTISEQVKTPESQQVIKQTVSELKDATTEVAGQANDNKGLLKKVVELTDRQESVLTDVENKVDGDAKKAVTEALDKATETKTAASQTLAKMEEKSAAAAGANSTSTQENLNSTSSPSTTGADKEKTNGSSTSTNPLIKKLGEPASTGTEIIIPLSENHPASGNETTTILQLK